MMITVPATEATIIAIRVSLIPEAVELDVRPLESDSKSRSSIPSNILGQSLRFLFQTAIKPAAVVVVVVVGGGA